MATIQKIINTNNPSYRVFIRRQGCKTLSKTFPTKKLAKEFALRMESNVSAMYSFQGKSSSTLFKFLVEEYLHKEYRGVRKKEQGRKLGYWVEILGEKLIIDTINHIQDEYNIDTTKIFIGGFSQGGMMALHILSKYPEKFKGFIAHSTRLLKDFEFQDNLSRYKNLNLLIIHGKRDLVLRIRNAYETKKIFEGMNSNIEFHELKIGHRITIDSINIIENWFSKISS